MTIPQARRLNKGDIILSPKDKHATPTMMNKNVGQRQNVIVKDNSHKLSKIQKNTHGVEYIHIHTTKGKFASHTI